jgi:hypothetical protein
MIKKDGMGRARSMNGEKWNAYRILVQKPEGNGPLGRPSRSCGDDIKMDLRGTDGVASTGLI